MMRRFQFRSLLIAVAIAGAFLFAAPSGVLAQTGKTMTTDSGLQIIDSKVGTGASPKPGQSGRMHYPGWFSVSAEQREKSDGSVDRSEPFEFPIGQRKVIAGW